MDPLGGIRKIIEQDGPGVGGAVAFKAGDRAVEDHHLIGAGDKGQAAVREGDAVGMHELVFNSAGDRIYLCHDAKSRQGYAEGAVRAAEWLAGKTGFFQFRDVWREL